MMTYDDYEGALACIEDALQWATVIVVGPGLGVDTVSERMLYELLMNAEVPMVVDADALNILSNNIELLRTSSVQIIMTPHMKEMSRLIQRPVEEIAKNRFAGDVLAGIIAGMLAGGLTLADAARMGTYVHCRAGDLAAEHKGNYAMLASDIISYIGEVMRHE